LDTYKKGFHDVKHYGSKLNIDSYIIDSSALNQQSQGNFMLPEYLYNNYHNTSASLVDSSYHGLDVGNVSTREMRKPFNQVHAEFHKKCRISTNVAQGSNVSTDFRKFYKKYLVAQTKSNSKEYPIQFATFLIENGFLDLDVNKFVERIFWLHIPKTGTSIFNTLYLHFCPKILELYPEIARDKKPKEIINKTKAKGRALSDRYLINQFNPGTWCNVSFYNVPRVGFHHPYKAREEKFMSFAMFRDPTKRLRSAFSFRPRLNVPHLSLRNDPNITFEDYIAEPHIQNCQLKMILGCKCPAQLKETDLDVGVALHRISSPFFFFGITDRWSESICLFHNWFGGSMQPYEMVNNRPTALLFKDVSRNKVNDSLDQLFFEGSTIIFEYRLSKAGCLNKQDGVK